MTTPYIVAIGLIVTVLLGTNWACNRRHREATSRRAAVIRHPSRRHPLGPGPDDGKGCLSDKELHQFTVLMLLGKHPTGVEPPRRIIP